MEKLQFERKKYGKELLMDACNEQELELVADTMVLNFYTIILLERCRGTYFLDTEEIPFRNNTVSDPVVLQFSRQLDKEARNNLTVEQFAERLSVSRVHLNNLCQKYFSKTAHQIIRERTTAAIKKEIRYSEKSFSEIAYEFNFSAPSHFARFFKQMTGLSPQAFREQLSNW